MIGLKVRLGKYGIAFFNAIGKYSVGILDGHAGTTWGPFIFIRYGSLADRGLFEHELVHTRQFWNPRKWFWGKLRWEVEAYKEQAKWYPEDRIPLFSKYLATRYGLNITVAEAERLLRS